MFKYSVKTSDTCTKPSCTFADAADEKLMPSSVLVLGKDKSLKYIQCSVQGVKFISLCHRDIKPSPLSKSEQTP